jgi:hypothetical protein
MKSEFTAKTPRRQGSQKMDFFHGQSVNRGLLKFEKVKKISLSVLSSTWRLGVLAVNIWFLPSVLLACPRCVDATPYKTGMQVAVAVLLPIPIVLVTALFFWIRNASKAETEEL